MDGDTQSGGGACDNDVERMAMDPVSGRKARRERAYGSGTVPAA